jgi:hypothetical protein
LKPKTGFESGSSPTATATVRVSENGAPIQTGHGLEETKRRIEEAFEAIRKNIPAPAQQPQQTPTPPQVEFTYKEQHKTRFHERAKRLSLAALSSSSIMKTKTTRGYVEIAAPTESAEELIREALGE